MQNTSEMTISLIALVLFSGLIHASWNALTKSAKVDPLASMSVMCLCGAAFSLFFTPFVGLPNAASVPYIIASGFIHIAYYLLVGLSYRHGDFSAVYPIFRGGAPLLTALLGMLFLGEWLPLSTLFGIILLVCGLLVLSVNAFKKGSLNAKAITSALLLAFVVALYTIVDGKGARLADSPFNYVVYTHIMNAICMFPVIIIYLKIDILKVPAGVWKRTLPAGALSVVAYAIVLYAMTQAPVGVVSALRETSVVFAAIIGWLFMNEKLGKWHFMAALLILIGLYLIKGLQTG